MHRVADTHAQERTRKEIRIDKYKRRREQILYRQIEIRMYRHL